MARIPSPVKTTTCNGSQTFAIGFPKQYNIIEALEIPGSCICINLKIDVKLH